MSEAKPKPKSGATLEFAVRLIFLVLLAFIGWIFTFGSLFILFYIPMVTWIIWSDRDRIIALEKKIAELEKKPGQS